MQMPCAHCGTPVLPETAFYTRDTVRFCCAGCRNVYQFLHQQGLAGYYRVLETPGVQQVADTVLDMTLPDPLPRNAEGIPTVTLYVAGIHCAACVWLLEKLPQVSPDVTCATVSIGRSTLQLQLREGASLRGVMQVIRTLGYVPRLLQDQDHAKAQKAEDRADLMRVGVTGAIAGNLMLLSVSVYGGASGVYEAVFSWVSLVLCLPLMTWGALPFYRSAVAALRQRHVSVDVPIALALVLGFVMSAVHMVLGNAHVYFDSLGMLVFLLLGSRYILKMIQRRADQVADLHVQVLPTYAQKCSPFHPGAIDPNGVPTPIAVEGTEKQTCSVSELQVGEVVYVGVGQPVPVDGPVIYGQSFVDSRWITGESLPQPVAVGAMVYAGTTNLESPLYVQVCATGLDSRIGKILSMMSEQPKARFAKVMDRLAQYILVGVLVLSSAVWVWFALTGEIVEGSQRILALLIVTCPCALAIATPLALAQGMRRAAKAGVLIRNPDAIEALGKVTHVFLDKTGTVTQGCFSVDEVSDLRVSDLDVDAIVTALEATTHHPIGLALRRYHQEKGGEPAEVDLTEVQEIPGQGVFGLYGGQRVAIVSDGASESRAPFFESGMPRLSTSVVFCVASAEPSVEWVPVRRYTLSDTLQPEAQEVIQACRAKGVSVMILSGDKQGAVAAVAHQLGLSAAEWCAGMGPEEKVAYIRQCPTAMMVGDGANDAAALRSAAVGVAVHGSLDISMKVADVYLGQTGLGGVLTLFAYAGDIRRVIWRNLGVSLVYNLFFCVAALLGSVSPIVAAIVMPMSSVTVVMSSLMQGKR